MNDGLIMSTLMDAEVYSLVYTNEKEGIRTFRIRGELCSTWMEFYREISTALQFPYYFGWNLDAVDECICDLDWLSFERICIVLDNYQLFFRSEKQQDVEKGYLEKHMMYAVDYWKDEGIEMKVYFNSNPRCKSAKRFL